jgi:hypothetical protein
MKTTRVEPVLDRVAAEPQSQQLTPGDDSVLALHQAPNFAPAGRLQVLTAHNR